MASFGSGNVSMSRMCASLFFSPLAKHSQKYTKTNTSAIRTIEPVLATKSANEYPSAVPMMMLGGSPHIVAAPPRLAQKICAKMTGTGSKRSSCASSTVTAAKNKMTVMLSINIDRTAAMIINTRKIHVAL